MSRRSCIIEKKIRQYQRWTVEIVAGKPQWRAQRPDRTEARVTVTRPGKAPKKDSILTRP